MKGSGYWGKGNNPYSNFDFDAAARDKEIHRIRDGAHKAQIENELAVQQKGIESDNAISNLRVQMNATITSHKKVVNEYEQKLENMKMGLYKLVMRSNVFHRTLVKLQERWPDKKDDILDEIQIQRDYCMQDEYRSKWWEWVNTFKENPDPEHEYLSFPFEKRNVKLKK